LGFKKSNDLFFRDLLAWLSLLPYYHWHLAGLVNLNPDKIYAPIQGIGEEYGSIAPQRHSQQLGQLEQGQDLLPALPSTDKCQQKHIRKRSLITKPITLRKITTSDLYL
jgi:hypothetical protein